MEIDEIVKIDEYTDKIRVYNGWLYRTITNSSVHTTFVPERIPIRKKI